MGEKVVFIDRDGVINRDPGGCTRYGYVTEWNDFKFLPGVLDAFKMFKEEGFRSVIISNQQSVGKGYCTEADLLNIDSRMKDEISKAGGEVTASYYCVHLKEDGCSCRKPKEGLFLKAQKELDITRLSDKFFIGDSERDIIAGKRADMRTILVLSGKTQKKDTESWDQKPDYVCEGLLAAVKIVTKETGEM